MITPAVFAVGWNLQPSSGFAGNRMSIRKSVNRTVQLYSLSDVIRILVFPAAPNMVRDKIPDQQTTVIAGQVEVRKEVQATGICRGHIAPG